jgi:ABC-type amino acid transport system permease subunit
MLDTSLSWNDILFLLRGASVTLSLTAWAVLGGTALGLVFGIVRASGPIWASSLLGAVLDVVACLTLSIYTAAYCTEVVRSGVLAVPKSTRRAARSLGMTYTQDLTSIVFPMATRVMLPSWIGLTLGVMKDTALVLWIGIVELLRASQTIITRIQEPMLVLAVAGLLYFLMSYPLARVGARLERKWKRQ